MTQAHWARRDNRLLVLATNVASRYVVMLAVAVIGLVVLPINLQYLGRAEYGLWMLTASVVTYFSVLELGYGGAIVRYVAEFRARKDAAALNETLSTMFYVFSGIGVLVYLLAIGFSFLLPYIFNLDAAQARTGQIVFLIIAVNISLHFVFSIFGGVINGFERYYLNNIAGGVSTILAAVVNVAVLMLGYGLVELVAATTLVRIVPYWFYRYNAYKVFPELEISLKHFRRERLRDLTGFSIYLAVIDWSAKLSYTTDAFILGMFMNTTAVAVYTVAQRLSDALVRMTNQLHSFLVPAMVWKSVDNETDSQQRLLVKATRFQFAISVCLCGCVAAVGEALLRAWVGPGYEAAVIVLRVLAATVVLRTLMAMPSTLLKSTGLHRPLAKASTVTAVANVLLSVAGVQLFGMAGVALGTLVPAFGLAFGFVLPLACRSVGLTPGDGLRQIVWPALWPVAVVVPVLAWAAAQLPARLATVLPLLGAGALLYAAVFYLFALDRQERQWFSTAINQVVRQRSRSLATA